MPNNILGAAQNVGTFFENVGRPTNRRAPYAPVGRDNIFTALQNLGTAVENIGRPAGQKGGYVGSDPAAVRANRRNQAGRQYYGPGFMSDEAMFPNGRGNVGGGNAGGSIQPPAGATGTSTTSWTASITPGARARQERMNELSQQAGGPNYSFETGFPREFEAARSAAPVVEQYRKDLASNPLADTPELIDQRSQAYGQRADIAKWLETMQKGSASDQAIAAKFLAKQRPAEQSMADSSVFNATEGDRRVAEAGYSGMKFDPETTRDLKAFEAGADWAASGMAGLKDSKFETGTSEYGGELLRDGAGIEAARRREIAESGYGSRSISPQDTAELATLGAGSKFTGTGVTHLADMKMTPATAETNRQINFEGSPLPEANAAQAESDNTDKFLANFMKNIGLR